MESRTDTLLDHLYLWMAPAALRAVSDHDLLTSFNNAHDQSAFSALVARHGKMVLNVCRRALANEQDAEDAFQATFMVLARKAASIRSSSSLAAWLYGAAYRVSLNARRLGRCRPRYCRLPEDVAVTDLRSDPLAELTARDLLAAAEEEIQRLPIACRLPVALCCLDGLTVQEAAQKLGVTEGSLKGNLERGRARLHQRFVRRGLILSASLGVLHAAKPALWAAQPHTLMVQTVKASLAFACTPKAALGEVSAEVWKLAQCTLKGTAMFKLKLVAAATILFGVSAFGANGLYPSSSAREKDATNAAAAPQQPKEKTGKARLDLYGDPLPRGAAFRFGTVRYRHDGPILSVAWSPDGKWLASAGGFLDNTVRIWESATGKELRRLPKQPAEIQAVAISPDGSQFASVDKIGNVSVWDSSSGKLRAARQMAAGVAVAYSARGDSIAAVAADGKLCLVDSATLKTLRDLNSEAKSTVPIAGITWSANRTMLATVDGSATAHVYDTVTGKVLLTLEHADPVKTAGFAPNDLTLATGTSTGTLNLWDLTTGNKIRTLAGVKPAIDVLSWAPDGKSVAGAGGTNVWIWDVAGGNLARRFFQPGAKGVAYSPDGKMLACVGDNTLRIWDAVAGKEIAGFEEHQGRLANLAVIEKGKTLLTGANYGFRLWDLTTGKNKSQFSARQSAPKAAAVSADGKWLATGAGDGSIEVHDLPAGKLIQQWKPDGSAVHRVAFSPDAKLLVASTKKNKTALWHVATGGFVRELVNATELMQAFAFNPDGLVLATGSDKGKIRIWHVDTGQEVGQLNGHSAGIQQLLFSPAAGNLMASASNDGTARLWDVITGKVVQTFRSPDGCLSVAISPDGRTVATGGANGRIHLWELASGKHRAEFNGDQGQVASLVFLDDGKSLVSGGADSTALRWDLAELAADKAAAGDQLTAQEFDIEWRHFLSDDAQRSYLALHILAVHPAQSIAKLQKELTSVPLVDQKMLAQWIADLGDKEFAVRVKAIAELKKAGDMARPALQQALQKPPSDEVRERIVQILGKPGNTSPLDLERLRLIRQLELLEQVGNAGAHKLIQTLATGPADAWLTQEAKAMAGRIKGKNP